MKKILLLPAWMTSLDLYENTGEVITRIGSLEEADLSADYLVGLSLGALEVLKKANYIKGKIILINPPIPKRNLLIWFGKWLSWITHEGPFLARQHFTKNPYQYGVCFIRNLKLLTMDFSQVLENFPKEKFVVIRGKNDNFFCDDKAVKFLNGKNIKIIETDGGHNWCEPTEKAMNQFS
jgi:hypothetical protein